MNSIILDLDKTLIHSIRVPDNDTFDKQESCGDNGIQLDSGYVTFKRPNTDRFLRWCFRKFDKVLVWSAGTSIYVHEIVNKMFDEFKFDLVLTRDHCTFPFRKDFNNPVVRKLMMHHRINIRKGKVVFVDDKLYRIQNNKSVNLVEIEPFESKWTTIIETDKKRKRPIREQDTSLLDVRKKILYTKIK